MQSQGCSVMLKSVEVAQWYLAANPGKMAVVLMSEAHTPFVAPLVRDEYYGFREIARMRKKDRKSTRLNSSHVSISYAVFCLKKKKKKYMKTKNTDADALYKYTSILKDM